MTSHTTPDNTPRLRLEQTTLEVWDERDRLHIELRDATNDRTIVEWWDDDARETITDGFLDAGHGRHRLHASAYAYAADTGQLPPAPPEPEPEPEPSPAAYAYVEADARYQQARRTHDESTRAYEASATELTPRRYHAAQAALTAAREAYEQAAQAYADETDDQPDDADWPDETERDETGQPIPGYDHSDPNDDGRNPYRDLTPEEILEEERAIQIEQDHTNRDREERGSYPPRPDRRTDDED